METSATAGVSSEEDICLLCANAGTGKHHKHNRAAPGCKYYGVPEGKRKAVKENPASSAQGGGTLQPLAQKEAGEPPAEDSEEEDTTSTSSDSGSSHPLRGNHIRRRAVRNWAQVTYSDIVGEQLFLDRSAGYLHLAEDAPKRGDVPR